jgi:hypothetical protein
MAMLELFAGVAATLFGGGLIVYWLSGPRIKLTLVCSSWEANAQEAHSLAGHLVDGSVLDCVLRVTNTGRTPAVISEVQFYFSRRGPRQWLINAKGLPEGYGRPGKFLQGPPLEHELQPSQPAEWTINYVTLATCLPPVAMTRPYSRRPIAEVHMSNGKSRRKKMDVRESEYLFQRLFKASRLPEALVPHGWGKTEIL